MRILTSKIAADATISSTSESANYPASNLSHNFLEYRWQPISDGTQTVTIGWSSAQSMNCVFIGYISDTISNIDIKIYNSGGLVETLSSVDISDGIGAYYFASSHADIITLEIIATGSGTMYIGGCEPGTYYQMPGSLVAHTGGQVDNSISSSSGWGQTQQQRIPWLDSVTYSWIGTRTVLDAVKAQLQSVGIGGTLWIDFYEEDHASKLPGYYKMDSFSDYQVEENLSHSWSISFVEAR